MLWKTFNSKHIHINKKGEWYLRLLIIKLINQIYTVINKKRIIYITIQNFYFWHISPLNSSFFFTSKLLTEVPPPPGPLPKQQQKKHNKKINIFW